MLTVECFTFNPFSENTYVLINEEKQCIIVDPGVSNASEQQVLLNYFQANDLKPIGVFLTHTHIDHVFGLNFIKCQFNVPIIAHRLANQGLQTVEMVANLYGLKVDIPPPIDQFIEEGEKIALGDHLLEVLFCPGHAPDHLVLYAKQEGFAIVGDVIFQHSIGRTDLPGGNYDILMESIHSKLLILPLETILYTGHGPETTINEEIKNNPFLK